MNFIDFMFGVAFFGLGFVFGGSIVLRWAIGVHKLNKDMFKLNKDMLKTLDDMKNGWGEAIEIINSMLPYLTPEQMVKMSENLTDKLKQNESKR